VPEAGVVGFGHHFDFGPKTSLACSSRWTNPRFRRPLRRVPRRALPSGAGRARRRVFDAGRVEGRAPTTLIVPGQLEIVALSRHADGDPPDASPGVEPGPQRPEVVGRARKSGEAECCSQELAALVEHALLDDLVRP
jgi:hypothetical protein